MIGERFYDLRKDKGITQEEMAKHLGLTKFTISSYENEKSCPNDDIKIAIAKYFDVSLDYLLGLIDEPLPYNRTKNTVVLPAHLPKSAIDQIRRFIQFVVSEYQGS